jgi:histidyl-tRNA synthetase
LVELLGGPPTPGVGWASGVERILLASSAKPGPPPPPQLYVVHDGARAAAFQLALAARAAGLRAELELGGRSLKGQFKHAERLNARFVAVVENQSVSLRDRERGTERTLGAAEVVGQVQRDLGA